MNILTISSKHGARIDAPAQNLCSCQHGISPLGRGIADRDNAGIDVELEFDAGLSPLCTPLHIAVCNGQKSTARLLLSRGADARACRDNHSNRITSILHTAARCNDATTIRYIVQRGLVDINLPSNISGDTALHCAALHENNTSALNELMSLGADKDIQAGSTPFVYACNLGNFRAALVLLNSGLRLFGREVAFWPLHHAVAPRSQYNLPPLQTAAEEEAWEQEREAFIHRVVSGDPEVGDYSINDLDHKQRPILFLAASQEAPLRTLKLLLDLGANINAQNKDGVTAIQEILRRGDATTTASIAHLLRRGARLDLTIDTGRWTAVPVRGYYALDTALLATNGNYNHPVLYTIFQHASKINFAENSLTRIVENLYRQGRHEDCKLIMIHGINGVRLAINSEWVRRWLQSSINARDLTQISLYLAQFRAYLTTRDALGMVLETYSRRQNARITQDLEQIEDDIIDALITRPDLDLGEQKHGRSTLLHFACKHHHIKTVPRLLDLGCRVDVLDEKCQTPLVHAVSIGCPYLVRILQQYGAQPFQRPSEMVQEGSKGEIFDLAREYPSNDKSAFQTALSRSCKEVDVHFYQAVCWTVWEDVNLVDLIIRDRGLPPFPTDPKSLTYIHEALQNPSTLKVLLERGADPNAGHIREQHPLLYAWENQGFTEEVLESIVHLIRYGARTNERHSASGKSFLDIVKAAHEAVAAYKEDPPRGGIDDPYFQAQCSLMRRLRLKRNPDSGQSVIRVQHARWW